MARIFVNTTIDQRRARVDESGLRERERESESGSSTRSRSRSRSRRRRRRGKCCSAA